jgi:pyroglutamyl-peptidase
MKRSLLITAFEPFGGDESNITDEILQTLSRDTTDMGDITYLTLPVSRDDALPALFDAIERHKPDTVVCLGQANDRSEISIEKVAVNLCCYRIPDNKGEQPDDEPVVMDGPAAYFATLPVNELVGRLNAEGIAAHISFSAGTYVCNSVFYGLLHFIERTSLGTRGGFVHVPRVSAEDLPEMTMAIQLVIRWLSDKEQVSYG